jgi:hypothetical protein
MQPKSFYKKPAIALAVILFSATMIAWQQVPQPIIPVAPVIAIAPIAPVQVKLPVPPAPADTVPIPKTDRQHKIINLDEALEELDNSKMQIDAAMKKIDWSKINAEIEAATKNIDHAKIQADIEKAMKEIDVQKIKMETDKAVASIDWSKIEKELEKVKEIDFVSIEKSMAQVKEEMKNLKPQIEKQLELAKKDIEKAKVEMSAYKDFINSLEKDGLINKNSSYTIENKNGELIINDKKQPAETFNKYRNFLDKHTPFTIKKTGDDFNIDNK